MTERATVSALWGYNGYTSGLNQLQLAYLNFKSGAHLSPVDVSLAPASSAADVAQCMPSTAQSTSASAHTPRPRPSLHTDPVLRAAVLKSARESTALQLHANHEKAVSLLQRTAAHSSSASTDHASTTSSSHASTLHDAPPSESEEWDQFPHLRTSAVYRLSNGSWSGRPGGRGTSLLTTLLRRDLARFTDGLLTPRQNTIMSSVVIGVPAVAKHFVRRISANTYQWVGPSPRDVERAALALGLRRANVHNIDQCVAWALQHPAPELTSSPGGAAAPVQEATSAAAPSHPSKQEAAVRAAAAAFASSLRTSGAATAPLSSSAIPLSLPLATGTSASTQMSGVGYEEDPDVAIDSIASLLG